jgi:hypothetical protein
VRPDVNINEQEESPPLSLPTATGRLFAVVVSEKGPNTVRDCASFADFKKTYGDRTPQTARYWDGIESFYKYGGGALTLVRARKDGVIATANLDDDVIGAPYSLVATAVGQGAWYNGINVAVEDDPDTPGNRRVVVTHDTDLTVSETSPYAADQQTLVDWSQGSAYIRLALGASANLPAVTAAVSLAGGTDDYATIVVDDRVAALAAFHSDLGPGQEAIPGATSIDEWNGILDSSRLHRRDAVLAYPDTADEATLTTLAKQARGLGRYGAAFAGWLREPGPAGRPKLVSPELAVCGKIAAWDAESKNLGQNKPVAGPRRGVLVGCLGVSQEWVDGDARTRLNAAGVNLIRQRPNGVTIFGWRSLADPVNDSGWVNFGHRRLQVALMAKIDAALESFLFEEIDGEGTLFKQVQGDITSLVVDPYFQAGSLFGASAADAYRVVCDFTNNTPDTIRDRRLVVDTTVVESEFAEEIDANLIKNLIPQGVTA